MTAEIARRSRSIDPARRIAEDAAFKPGTVVEELGAECAAPAE